MGFSCEWSLCAKWCTGHRLYCARGARPTDSQSRWTADGAWALCRDLAWIKLRWLCCDRSGATYALQKDCGKLECASGPLLWRRELALIDLGWPLTYTSERQVVSDYHRIGLLQRRASLRRFLGGLPR